MRTLAEFVAVVAGIVVWIWLCRASYNDGVKDGYAKGRREIDTWWVEMDNQLDEEWLKIWREER
jgi:hypothetical protein